MLGTVLFVGATPALHDERAPALRANGFEVAYSAGFDASCDQVESGHADVVLCSVDVGGPGAFELCRRVAISRPDVRCIILGGEASYECAMASLRAGAFDYLVPPFDDAELSALLHRALQHRALRDEVKRLRTALAEATGFEELIGVSPPMLQLYELLEQAACSNASVLISGESGTGKELVARALHRRSLRRDGPFVAVNCAAIPETLLESELFGHVKGAFTDAQLARSGLFVKAAGGSVFLDEIGDMPLSVQPKLLRALQERSIRPVGGDTELSIDVRVISATNKNLEALVAEREFREDLFYRIHVIHVEVPPLRERASDVLLLAQHYVEHYALVSDKSVRGIAPSAAERLLAYPWPGNVRELQNCVERAVALTRNEEIQLDDLPERVRRFRRNHVLVVSADPSELVPMDEVERRYIFRVLQAVGGNKREAARILGFDRKTLYRKLARFESASGS